MKKYIKDNKFVIFLFAFSFIIRLIIISIIETPIISDFKMMYDASLEILNGTSNYRDSIYFTTWGYQMGHVIYQVFLLKIFNSVFFLKIINSIITSLTVVFIYLISAKVSSKRTSQIISLLYSIFLFPLFLNTVLTNQLLPILLILISIYILINIDNKYVKKSIIIGLLLGISNILRSEGIVIIFSIFLYYLYLIIKKHNIKNILSSFIIILISYTLIFNLTSFILIKTDISKNGLNNMNKSWKFVLGFNYETNGMYSEEDALNYSSDNIASKIVLKERIKEINKMPLHFLKKIKIQWLGSDLSWSIGHVDNKIYSKLNNVNKIFIYIFTILALTSLLNYKNISNIQIIATFILATYFGVYLLIEVMPRYAYSMQVFEAILSSIGLDLIIKKVRNH